MTPIPEGFFDGPLNKQPTAGVKGLNQCLPSDVPLSDPPMSKPVGKGVLPPPEDRTAKKEEQLKQTQKKDIEAAEILKSNTEPVAQTENPQGSAAWKPVMDPAGPAGKDVIEGQGSRHTGIYSKDGMPRVFKETTPEEDLKALAEYVKGLEANKLVEKPEKEKTVAEKTSLKGEYGKKYESSSKGEETKTSKKAILEYKAFEKKWQYHDDKDEEGTYQHHLRVFGAGVDAKAGAGNLGKEGYGATAGVSANAGLLDWENSVNSNGVIPGKAQLKVKAVEAEAKAEVEGTVNYKEGKATLGGELGLDATLLEVEAEGEIKVVPARWVDAACNHTYLGRAKYMDQLCEAVKKDTYDYGISIKLGGAAGTGLGAKAKGKAKYEKGKLTLEGEAGLKAAVGGKVKLGAGAGHFER
jgi:hypothetical protein